MRLTLLPGVDSAQVRRVLDECLGKAADIRGAGYGRDDMVNRYLEWSRVSADRLSPLVSAKDVSLLFLTRTYWALLTVPGVGQVIYTTVQVELDARLKILQASIDWLESMSKRWSYGFGPLVVLDTSVFLEHRDEFPQSLARIEQIVVPSKPDDLITAGTPVQFVVPLQVVDELDMAKSDRARGRARTALARINEAFEDPGRPAVLDGLRNGTGVHLLMDEPGHARMPDEDDEIVDRGVFLNSVTGLQGVGLACMDTGMAMRARMAGLTAFLLDERRAEKKEQRPARGGQWQTVASAADPADYPARPPADPG